jgi:hypothetical protein
MVSFLLFGGCTNTIVRPANFISPSLNVQQIGTIYIMPMVDCRLDKKQKINFKDIDAYIAGDANHYIKPRNYTYKHIKDRSLVAGLRKADLAGPNIDRLQQINLPGARWLLFFVLDDMYVKAGLVTTHNAEVTMLLLDRDEGQLLLKHKAVGQIKAGIITAPLQSWQRMPIIYAWSDCLETIPIRIKE